MRHSNFDVWLKLKEGGKILVFVYFDSSSWKTGHIVAIEIHVV